jgi:hypothetical protein
MEIEEKHLDMLQNIETAIVSIYRSGVAITDYDVKDAIEALIRYYRMEKKGQTSEGVEVKEMAGGVKLQEVAQQIYDLVKLICEHRLGRIELKNIKTDILNVNTNKQGLIQRIFSSLFRKKEQQIEPLQMTPITLEELISCLRRIENSIKKWNKQGGRKGYLTFVEQFIK